MKYLFNISKINLTKVIIISFFLFTSIFYIKDANSSNIEPKKVEKNKETSEVNKVKENIESKNDKINYENVLLNLKNQIFLDELENKYLKYENQLLISYENTKSKIKNDLFDLSKIILFVIGILGFLGIKTVRDFFKKKIKFFESLESQGRESISKYSEKCETAYSKVEEYKKYIETRELSFKKIEETIKEKEKELHERYGFLTESGIRHGYSKIDKAKFLEYDHLIYFYRIYLPTEVDYNFYKESLLKLGIFFSWDKDYGRAILRFEEIENIQNIINHVKNRTGKDAFENENILGAKTAKYYNVFGNACLQYVLKNIDNDESRKYVDKALDCLTKSIYFDPNVSQPYFSLGKLFSLTYKDDNIGAIKWYEKVFGKEPQFLDTDKSIYWMTYRNIACCLVRLSKTPAEIVIPLEKIPENVPYWKEIVEDEVLSKIKDTPEWSALIKNKWSNLKEN